MKIILFKPFEKFSEVSLLFFGAAMLILSSILSHYLSMRFDGVFDIHISSNTSIVKALLDNIFNSLSLFIWLAIAAKIINSKTRLVDILAVSLVARIPLYFSLFFNITGTLTNVSDNMMQKFFDPSHTILPSDVVFLIIFSFIIIPLIIWYVALLYNGFKVSSNAKGAKSVVYFVAALIFSEITSKILIIYINA